MLRRYLQPVTTRYDFRVRLTDTSGRQPTAFANYPSQGSADQFQDWFFKVTGRRISDLSTFEQLRLQ